MEIMPGMKTALAIVTVLLMVDLAMSQYETPNNLCGGYFKNYHGSIDFNFTEDTIDTNKVCIWTITPIRRFSAFSVSVRTIGLSCNEDYAAISAFRDRDFELGYNSSHCSNEEVIIENIEASGIVVVLKVSNVSSSKGIYLEYRVKLDNGLNAVAKTEDDDCRIIKNYYSWGRHSSMPLPYFAAHFGRCELYTFAFPRGNETSSSFVLEIDFDHVQFGTNCAPNNENKNQCDFIIAYKIQDDGTLKSYKIYWETENSLEPIRSKFGFFLIAWGAVSSTSSGAFQMKYHSLRG